MNSNEPSTTTVIRLKQAEKYKRIEELDEKIKAARAKMRGLLPRLK